MKLNFKFNLANQILIGYLFIIVVAIMASLFSVVSLRNNQAIDQQITKVNLPFYLNLKELNVLVNDLNKLTNSWIYQPNAEEKKRLLDLLGNRYPQMDKTMRAISEASTDSDNESVIAALSGLKEISENELRVTQLLNVDSLYASDVVVDEAIQLLDKIITPKSSALATSLATIIGNQEKKLEAAQADKERSYAVLTTILLLMVGAFLVTAIAAYVNVRTRIVKPIVQIRDVLADLGRGKIVNITQNGRADEIGQMLTAVGNLAKGINSKSTFASQIGMGKYEEHFDLLSDDDSMGEALLTMRDNLKKNAEEERKRNWSVTGLAQFGELLRNQEQELEKFGDKVLTFIIRYLKANQGRLYVVNDDDGGDAHLQLISCYAWEKKKFLEQKIGLGQGLTGQCWQEGDPIFMTHIPENYVKITSGLGQANPTNIFIVPLKVNDRIFGVLELASFNPLPGFERDFIVKLSENLAAAVSTVRINDKTRVLLSQTQQQAEEMRAQEEEMRQNMEELNATQEEMSRKEKEYINKIKDLEERLAANQD